MILRVPPYIYDEQGRRVAAPSKGERREQSILDEAEKQLSDAGWESMTVESIANAAGITRAALYFYFRSKNDVLAALVQRTVTELSTAVSTSDAPEGTSVAAALTSALRRTEDLWRRHGSVMRAAVELSPTVAAVGELWAGARRQVVDGVLAVIDRGAATPMLPGVETEAVVTALVGMTEFAFHQTFTRGADLGDTTEVLAFVWHRALGIAD